MSETAISAAQIEALWNQHLDGEFQSKDVKATLATMVEGASVLDVPVHTGGRGRAALRAFYTPRHLSRPHRCPPRMGASMASV